MEKDKTGRALNDHASLIEDTFRQQAGQMKDLARQVVEIFHRGGKLLMFGNGAMGAISGLVANHFLHRLSLERPLLPVISLCHNAVLATSLARGGESRQYFSRQLRALAVEGDMVLAFCDAHRDEALEEALATARQMDCETAAVIQGKAPMDESPAFIFRIETDSAARGLEAALFFGHLLVEMVEGELFGI
jgi:D-sedoheptulose 7-phosphate isomerase